MRAGVVQAPAKSGRRQFFADIHGGHQQRDQDVLEGNMDAPHLHGRPDGGPLFPDGGEVTEHHGQRNDCAPRKPQLPHDRNEFADLRFCQNPSAHNQTGEEFPERHRKERYERKGKPLHIGRCEPVDGKHDAKRHQKAEGALWLAVHGDEQQAAGRQNQFKPQGMAEKQKEIYSQYQHQLCPQIKFCFPSARHTIPAFSKCFLNILLPITQPSRAKITVPAIIISSTQAGVMDSSVLQKSTLMPRSSVSAK